MQKRIFVLAGALIAAPLPAQQPASAASAGGAAQARPPALAYQSVFADYRAWHEPAPIDWRDANREAGALGGHMGQLRGRPPANPAKDRTPAPSPTDAAAERVK